MLNFPKGMHLFVRLFFSYVFQKTKQFVKGDLEGQVFLD